LRRKGKRSGSAFCLGFGATSPNQSGFFEGFLGLINHQSIVRAWAKKNNVIVWCGESLRLNVRIPAGRFANLKGSEKGLQWGIRHLED